MQCSVFHSMWKGKLIFACYLNMVVILVVINSVVIASAASAGADISCANVYISCSIKYRRTTIMRDYAPRKLSIALATLSALFEFGIE